MSSKCAYVYAEGLRFATGSVHVLIEHDGRPRRMQLVPSGSGKTDWDKDFISISDLKEMVANGETIEIQVRSKKDGGFVGGLKLDPHNCEGGSGRRLLPDPEQLDRRFNQMERARLAVGTLESLSYGDNDRKKHQERLYWALNNLNSWQLQNIADTAPLLAAVARADRADPERLRQALAELPGLAFLLRDSLDINLLDNPHVNQDDIDRLRNVIAPHLVDFDDTTIVPSLHKAPRSTVVQGASDGQYVEVPTWTIEGRTLLFSTPNNPGLARDGVEIVPRSPYAISGLAIDSDEGFELAIKYTAAVYAANRLRGTMEETVADALLYSAVRGDKAAEERFERLAQIGEAFISEEARQALPLHRNPAAHERAVQAVKEEGLEDVGVDDLWLVHESRHPFPVDEAGNITMWPAGHYMKDQGVHRPTIHFAVNHVVADIPFYRAGVGAENYVMIRLKDVIDANPGCVEGVNIVDTYLTPRPGRPLVLPNGSFHSGKYETVEKTDPHTGETETIRDRRAPYRFLQENGARVFDGSGGAYSSAGADALMARVGRDLGRPQALHSQWHSRLDVAASYPDDGVFFDRSLPTGIIPHLSRNARAQLVAHTDWCAPNELAHDSSGPLNF